MPVNLVDEINDGKLHLDIDAVDYADIRLIMGDQRSGKSTRSVAFSVDDYYAQLTGIIVPNNSGQTIKASYLDKKERQDAQAKGVIVNPLKHIRVYSEDGRQSKIIEIPKGWLIKSPVKIFANFHLYGIRYVPTSLAQLIEYMNSDLFHNSWILTDESVMTDARNSMDMAGKLVAGFGATIGKRRAHLNISVQYSDMTERRFRRFATTRVWCSYDKTTKLISCDVKHRGDEQFSYDFYAPNYWRFFDTNEIIPVPQYKINRVLKRMYGEEEK